jgi:SAM-dependent methyltransferase
MPPVGPSLPGRSTALLVATLGEVLDLEGALGELHRVLRPGGRLVAGEGAPDPHMVPFGSLRRLDQALSLSVRSLHTPPSAPNSVT